MKCPPGGHVIVTAEVMSADASWRPCDWPPWDARDAGCTCPDDQPLKRGTFSFDQCCPLHEVNHRDN